MGKKVKGWVPPEEDQIIEASPTDAWVPPADDEIIDPVKKKDGPDPVTPSASGSASVEPGKPSAESGAKPTPTTHLKERVGNFVTTSKNAFLQEAGKKRAELQEIVNADPSQEERVNQDFQKFLTEREQAYNTDLDKWMGIYSNQFVREEQEFQAQKAKEDFEKNKITNPLKSLGVNVWATFSNDLPAAAFGARALGRSTVKKIDEKAIEGMEALGVKPVDQETGAKIEQMFTDAVKFFTGSDAKSKPGMTRSQAENKLILDDIRSSINNSKWSAEKKKYLIDSLDKVKDGDFVDWMNYAASAVGQGIGQIPASVGTKGASSLVQQMGNIYIDSVQKIAREQGLSIEEVINQGKDDVVYPLIFGVGTGLLDAIGARGVAGAVTKKQVMDSFRSRTMAVLKAGGKGAGTEAATEAAQGALEQIGISKAADQTWAQALSQFKWDEVVEGALQGGIAGLFLGSGGRVLSNTFDRITAPKVDVKKVVAEEKANIVPTDEASVEAAAEKIEKAIDESGEYRFDKPVNMAKPEVQTTVPIKTEIKPSVITPTDENSGTYNFGKDEPVTPDTGAVEAVPTGTGQPGTSQTAPAEAEGVLPVIEQQASDTTVPPGDGAIEPESADVQPAPDSEGLQKSSETDKVDDGPTIAERIEKLDPYESQGYNLTQNTATKKLMQEMPERAKVAFEIMDFAKKVWPNDLTADMEKHPLAHVGQFFFGDANSVKEWVDMQIKGERQDIESNQRYIDSLKAKPKISKADQDSIDMWEDSIKSAEKRIQEYEKAYENEQKTKSPDGEGDAVQPVIGTDISGTETAPVPDGRTRDDSGTEEQQGEPVVVDAPAQQGSEDGGGNVSTDQAPAAQGGVPTDTPPPTDSVALDDADGEKLSGIKKALVPEDKVDETPIERRGTEDMLQRAKEDVDNGRINPKAIVDEISKGNARALQPDEVAALVYYKAQLDRKADSLNQELIDAIEVNDPDAQLRARVQLEVLNQEIDNYHTMSLKTAYEQSLAFRLRQMLLDNEYNLASQILRYKAANNGEISPEVEARFKELDEQLKAANLRIKALEEQQAKAAAEQATENIKAELKRQQERRLKAAQARKAKINDFFDSLKVKSDPNKLNNVFQVVGEGVYNGAIEAMRVAVLAGSDVATVIQAGVDYINEHYRGTDFNPDDFRAEVQPKIEKVVPKDEDDNLPAPVVDEEGRLHIPAKLIRHFAEISEDIDQLTDNIFRIVQEVFPDITRREVRDAITRYGETKNLSKDELDVKLREMKRIGRLISSLEDVQGGERPKRSGLQRDKPSDKERRLMKEVKEAMKDLPVDEAEMERNWRTALDAVKARLKNQISDLENQIKTGEKTPKKKGIEYDAEANALKEQRDKLRAIIQQIEGKPKMSDEQKIRMAIAGVERNIAELERRISARDVAPSKKSTTPVTPELQTLRDRRKELAETYKQLQDELGVTEKKRLELQKKAVKAAIDRYQKRIDKGDFAPKKKTPIAPDAELNKLKLERDKIKNEFDVLQEKARYANRPMSQKIWDAFVDVINLPKSFLASLDMSAPFRQGAVLSITNPKAGARSFNEMFRQTFSEQKANEWLLKLRETDIYAVMKNAKLYLAEPTARHTAREEQFLSNLAGKIPVVGRLVKASERAYTGYLNKLRADVFANGADRLREQGITPENNPEAYKALASFINNATGRGNLGGAETAANVLNAFFFSPRYLASRVNLLNPVTYAKMPAPVRKMALKSMVAWIGFNTLLLALADAAFDDVDVEWDPRSSDFGKLRIGDTRYDPWAGFQQVVRFMAQLTTGERKSTRSGEITKIDGTKFPFETRLDVVMRFFRTKLSPSAGSLVNILEGENLIGEEVTPESELLKNVIPLYMQDMAGIYQEEGPTGILSTGIPAFFGIGVQSYGEKSGLNTPTVDPEGMISAMNKKHKYSISQVDRRDLAKSFEQDVTTEMHAKYQEIKDREIKRLFDKYHFRLKEITDRDIYDKSMDAIVKEADRKAKYDIARENRWDTEKFKEGNKFFLRSYVKRNGKVEARKSLFRN